MLLGVNLYYIVESMPSVLLRCHSLGDKHIANCAYPVLQVNPYCRLCQQCSISNTGSLRSLVDSMRGRSCVAHLLEPVGGSGCCHDS
jgi:hypothetical protein